jgi:hypothetical protein
MVEEDRHNHGRMDVGMACPIEEASQDMNQSVSSAAEASMVASLGVVSSAVSLTVAPECGLQHTY